MASQPERPEAQWVPFFSAPTPIDEATGIVTCNTCHGAVVLHHEEPEPAPMRHLRWHTLGGPHRFEGEL